MYTLFCPSAPYICKEFLFVIVLVSHVVVVVNLVRVPVDGLAALVGRLVSGVAVLHLGHLPFISEYILRKHANENFG